MTDCSNGSGQTLQHSCAALRARSVTRRRVERSARHRPCKLKMPSATLQSSPRAPTLCFTTDNSADTVTSLKEAVRLCGGGGRTTTAEQHSLLLPVVARCCTYNKPLWQCVRRCVLRREAQAEHDLLRAAWLRRALPRRRSRSLLRSAACLTSSRTSFQGMRREKTTGKADGA